MSYEQDIRWYDAASSVSKGTFVSAGKINVLGLAPIKERLGDKWNRMSDLVHRYFEAAIRREMQPGDTFCHSGELAYLVLFKGATLAETRFKCRVVAEDVCKRLFGEQGENIIVRNLTLPVDAVDLDDIHEQVRLSDLLERDGREILVPAKPCSPDTVSDMRLRLDSDSAVTHTINQQSPSFIYRPLWDSVRCAVLTYICQPMPDAAPASTHFSGLCVAADGEQQQLELDKMVLHECLRRAHYLRQSGLRVLLAAPLHFSTLSRTRHSSQYLALRNAVPAALFRDIAFVIHGVDPTVPNIRLTAELPRVTAISKQVFCIASESEKIGQQFRNTGVHAIGVACRPGRTESDWTARLRVLTREARNCGLESFALGTPRRSFAVNALGAGVRYLEGPAVRTPVADPKFAFAHKIEDLYRARSA